MRFARFAVLFIRVLFRPKVGVLDESVLRLRVWVNEADLSNVHQAIYLLYMELGRWDLALRTYFEHRIERNAQTYAICHARIMFIGRGKRRVSPAELSVLAGGPSDSPPLCAPAELLASYSGYSLGSHD